MTQQLINLDKELFLAYSKLKEQFNTKRDSETLWKYKILSQAYRIGKKLYGHNFSVRRLSDDFELPYTTTKRCLALSKANSITWQKIKQKKISAFKACMVLYTKDTVYQDEIIDLVIKKNLSTYDIKKIRVKEYKDIEKTRLNQAIKEGFARKNTAYDSLNKTLERLNSLLTMNITDFPESKKENIIKQLNNTIDNIEQFLLK